MSSNPPANLDRFKDAQNQTVEGYESALTELQAGGKRSHWIWYIFPQLQGLGSSPNARLYALHDLTEAAAYLSDPLLGPRLLTISSTVSQKLHEGVSLQSLMNSSIDVQKLVSSMTLFRRVAASALTSEPGGVAEQLLNVATDILSAAKAQGFEPCHPTLERLAAAGVPE